MKDIAVIGCGQFGSSVALTLSELGHDVLVIDENEDLIDAIADKVSHAVVADVMVEGTLKDLGIGNFDVVIIGMSTSFQASIMATIIAKDLGVPMIVAKVRDSLHGRVLKKVGADKIVIPEKDMGTRLAYTLTNKNIIEFIEVSEDYSMIELEVPKKWLNMSIFDLKVREEFGVSVVAIRTKEEIIINPTPEIKLTEGATIIIIGKNEEIKRVESLSDA
ncbi:potassium channel family protein [Microaceticoccus formicicus]|uniref:potassium channel family protein n=1 Tax=Microaceticoccus formicicus TaxID=3118105 RepID=UPI003CD030EC|nr:TrkA family potassium uptake protein [Peptoniphilaceae bacterium AMB_02]